MSAQRSIALGDDSATPDLASRPLLDHLILLVDSLEHATSHFASLGFEVKPGGRHADGITENALVVLPDGVYFELIAFVPSIPDSSRKSHWWGSKTRNGWIDWALTPAKGQTAAEVVERANKLAEREGGNERWDVPKSGGRKTPEGKELQWEVAFPKTEGSGPRGRLPFICGDKTPREWRVPPPTKAHPNGAEGITSIEVLAQPTRLSALTGALSSLLEPLPPGPSGTSDAPSYARARHFVVRTPFGQDNVDVVVREAEGEEEEAHVKTRGEGLYSVGVRTSGHPNKHPDSSLGKITFS